MYEVMADKSPQDTLVLVTGASGFLASHVVLQLLQKGYKVRGTVRSLKNKSKVDPVRQLDAFNKLELVEADLMDDKCWESAVAGCDYVLHVASPFPMVGSEETVRTAITGTLNVLKECAKCSSVKKVVLTSSIVAIMEGHPDKKMFNEEDWTDIKHKSVDYYQKSKTLAEQAAWKFQKEIGPDGNKFRLSVINPGFILGPPVILEQGTSQQVVRGLLLSENKMNPPLSYPVVDVRDVAFMHIAAMESVEADGHRFLATVKTLWFKDMANALAKEFKKHGYDVKTSEAPAVLVKLMGALGNEKAANVKNRLNVYGECDSSKAIRILGVKFRDADESIVEMAYVMVERGQIKRSKTFKGVPKKYGAYTDVGKYAQKTQDNGREMTHV